MSVPSHIYTTPTDWEPYDYTEKPKGTTEGWRSLLGEIVGETLGKHELKKSSLTTSTTAPASYTQAAISLLAQAQHVDQKQVLDDLVFHMSRFDLELSQPLSMTLHDSTSEKYWKKPMIGGETFRVCGAYFGKRGDVIFQMRRSDVTTIASETYEIVAKEAEEVLEHDGGKLENLICTFVDGSTGKADLVSTEPAPESEDIIQSRMSDSRFGSW